MNAQQLKNAILQMAVSGKLVPQDPNDEPASVLLERIRKEKEELIKAGKTKREKNPSYIFCGSDNTPYEKIGDKEPISIANEIPFDIPDSWEWVRLGSISTYAETKQKINAKDADPNIWGLDLEDIEKGGKLLTKQTVKERKAIGDKTVFYKGDILYSKLRPYLLKILIADEDGICTSEIVPFKVYGEINSEYIVAYLKSPYVDSTINAASYGIKMPRAGTETMTSLFVPIPPINEQYRIVSKLKTLNPFINQYADKENHLSSLYELFPEQLKKSILQQAVQGKLVPQDPNDEPASALLERIRAKKERLIAEGKIKRDKNESVIYKRDNSHYEKINGIEHCIDDEIPFDIPDSWKWMRLFSFGQFSSGKTPSMADTKNWNGTIPWVSAKDMKNPVIVDSEMHITTFAAKSMQLYPKGTLLLVARSGILRRKLPLCVLGIDSTINQDIKAFQLYDPDLSEWLFYALEAYEPRILHDLVKSVTTVESLKFDEFSKMLIPLPSLHEQVKILDKVKQIISDIKKLQ